MKNSSKIRNHVGIILPDIAGGGAEKAMLTLAKSLIESGNKVDLVLLSLRGQYRKDIPDGLRLFYGLCKTKKARELLQYCLTRRFEVNSLAVRPWRVFRTWSIVLRHYPRLRLRWREARAAHWVSSYIRSERPQLILSALPKANCAAQIGAELADCGTPVVVSLRNNVGLCNSYWGRRMTIARALTSRANAVVAVSQGVADDAIDTLGLDARRVHTIYNPKPIGDIRRLADEGLNHSWFEDDAPPVILNVLRAGPQKDWPTLIRAFGLVRRQTEVRLAILGRVLSDDFQGQVFALAKSLGVERDVLILGFDENPYRYMRRAALFVLSSRWEGLPNVLIESLACGTPVVSTDAPYGPAEILEGGRWGKLTPVGDAEAMARAILASLAGETVPAEALRRRAGDFSVERAASAYLSLFDELLSNGAAVARGG